MKFFEKKDTPTSSQPETISPPPASPVLRPAPAVSSEPSRQTMPSQRVSQSVIGSTVSIKGEIVAEENIIIEGLLDGTIETSRDVTVAPEGRVRADIRAASIVIAGKVKGNVTATNKVELAATGQLEGNIRAPRLSVAESALFRGSIDMSAPGEGPTAREADKKTASR